MSERWRRGTGAVLGCGMLLALLGSPGPRQSANASAPGLVGFVEPAYVVNEAAGQASLTLRRSGGTEGVAVARLTVTDVTTWPTDYRSAGDVDPAFVPPTVAGF